MLPPLGDVSADGSQVESKADFVCLACKLHKKACDKRLPRCSRCVRRTLECQYIAPSAFPATRAPNGNMTGLPGLAGYGAYAVPLTLDATSRAPRDADGSPFLSIAGQLSGGRAQDVLCRQICELLKSMGQDVDQNVAKYFRGNHVWMPFLSRDKFYADLSVFPASQAADFGALLLCAALLGRHPKRDAGGELREESLYLAVKLVLSACQTALPHSPNLLKAQILLAIYEYAHRRSAVASTTIGMAIRMAYSLRMNLDFSRGLHCLETYNIWWMLIICERMFVLETANPQQPVLIPLPPEFLGLPREESPAPSPASSHTSASSSSQVDATGLGRAAQATIFLHRVQSCSLEPLSAHFCEEFACVDRDLQLFLNVVLQEQRGSWGVRCGAIAIAIKAMYCLHLSLLSRGDTMHDQDRWMSLRANSAAALDTVTNIMIDIADEDNTKLTSEKIDALPPTCLYIVQHAIDHATHRKGHSGWKSDRAVPTLQNFHRAFLDRWWNDE